MEKNDLNSVLRKLKLNKFNVVFYKNKGSQKSSPLSPEIRIFQKLSTTFIVRGGSSKFNSIGTNLAFSRFIYKIGNI